VLKKHPESLCRPEAEDLARKILVQLGKGKVNYRKEIASYSWKNLAKKLDAAIRQM
jgi:hypothetical protein